MEDLAGYYGDVHRRGMLAAGMGYLNTVREELLTWMVF